MKKFFLLIPALVLSIVLNAKVINIAPGTSLAYTINDAEAGDVIVMADGLYSGEDQLHLTKDITIKAADGATPVVQTTYYSELKSGAKVYIEGITFDGSTTAQQCIRVYDATDGKELHLNKCEFKNYPKDVISGDKAEYTLDSCVINNCYFHNNNYSPIYFNKSSVEGKQTIYGLIVKNSTFANNDPSKEYRATIDVQSYNRDATDDIEVLIDHCTFYNNTTKNYDYSAIRTRIINRTTVSNCIFAHPSLIEFYATNVWAGTVTNCLAYNLNKGYMSGSTCTNANTGNPLFTDAANGDYTFAGDWVTPSISPARGTATDGSDLGDPRWYSAEVLPSTNFIAPYHFVGAKAQLSGNIWYDDVNEYLYYNNKSTNGTAKWKIHAERACVVGVALNLHAGSPTVHKLKVEILNADGNSIGELSEQASTLPGSISIPAEGDYTITLNDDQGWTSAQIDNITLAYVGGAIVTVPAEELVGTEAVLVNDGSLKVSKLENGDLKYGDNGSPLTEYVYWNINATKYGRMDVTLNVVAPGEGNPSGHQFLVELYSNLNESPIVSTQEPSSSSNTGEIKLPAIDIPAAGDYIVKLTNQTQWSSAILHSIEFAYAGGQVANIPGEIFGADAMLLKEDGGTLKMYHDANGDIQYNDNGYNLTEYALWNINVTDPGEMVVSFNSPSGGHNFLFELYEGTTLLGSVSEEGTDAIWEHNVTLANHLTIPAAGDYTLKLINRTKWSSAILHSITFTPYVAPAAIEINEAAIDNSAWVANVGGAAANVKLIRTFKGGVYNSICVPFAASMSKIKAAFGDDVELLYLNDATMSGDILNLEFADAPDFYQGTPYLIKPSADVVNPEFTGVQLLTADASSTSHTGWAASYRGTFVKQNIAASVNNLYLGTDNKLYFSNNDVTIKGLRAYFVVNVPNPQQNIKAARIVKGTQVMTDVELVGAEDQTLIKTIENGQLIIIRDGNRYNVMGSKIQ